MKRTVTIFLAALALSQTALAASYECDATNSDYEEFVIKFGEGDNGHVSKIDFFDNDQWHAIECSQRQEREDNGLKLQNVCLSLTPTAFKNASIFIAQDGTKKVRLVEIWLDGSDALTTEYACKEI